MMDEGWCNIRTPGETHLQVFKRSLSTLKLQSSSGKTARVNSFCINRNSSTDMNAKKVHMIHVNPNFRRSVNVNGQVSNDLVGGNSETSAVYFNPHFFKAAKFEKDKHSETIKVHVNPKLMPTAGFSNSLLSSVLKGQTRSNRPNLQNSYNFSGVYSTSKNTKYLHTFPKPVEEKVTSFSLRCETTSRSSYNYINMSRYNDKSRDFFKKNGTIHENKKHHLDNKSLKPQALSSNRYKYISKTLKTTPRRTSTSIKRQNEPVYSSKTKLINAHHLKILPRARSWRNKNDALQRKQLQYLKNKLAMKHFNMKQKQNQNLKLRMNHFPNRTLIQLGGILYTSTSNKLTRTKGRKLEIKEQDKITKIKKGTKLCVVHFRGEKFVLDEAGKTFKRQTAAENRNNNVHSIRRMDFGGVTYVQKSQDLLIQTNTHHARYVLNHAKQKSIALLSHLRKRNNLPCMIYHKFGRCLRLSKGLCPYVHDSKNVSLCKNFLKGKCTMKDCLLSHELVEEKMATCRFFLQGRCVRDNCPYPHVKVNKRAAICRNFLQGFCRAGQNCKKRHLYQCPDFNDGSCRKGGNCPYPHKQESNRQISANKTVIVNQPSQNDKVLRDIRYHRITSKKKRVGKSRFGKCNSQESSDVFEQKLKLNDFGKSDEGAECVPKRIKLDVLPCFIPLVNVRDKPNES